jgi:pyrroline-5-carboxylate reductase
VSRDQTSWGIVGIGQLGASLVTGIFQSQAPVTLCLSPRSESRVRDLAARYPLTVAAHNQAVVDNADHIVLAVRPGQLAQVAGALNFRSDQVVVSVAAALNLASVQEAIGPATAVRAMPVLSAAISDSPTCIYPANDSAVRLFQHLGSVHSFDDEAAFATAAVAATYYGWLYALMDASARWLEGNGVATHTSRALIAQMTRAASSRALACGGDMGAMAAEIARPGTLTEIGMDFLSERGALEAWRDACQRVLDACRERER